MRTNIKKLISKSWFRLSLFLIFWFAGFILLLIFSSNSKISNYYLGDSTSLSKFIPLKNQIGKLYYSHFDKKHNNRPIQTIRFNCLETENGKVGFLRTPLTKKVIIQDLEIKLYRYGSNVTTSSKFFTIDKLVQAKSKECHDFASLVKDSLSRLTNPNEGFYIGLIDLSNITEVIVNNFGYALFDDSNQILSIRSKRMVAPLGQSNLLLHGHVSICSQDGDSLEANRIYWDLEKEFFSIEGFYVLNHNGQKYFGRNACFDTELNLVTYQLTGIYKEEDKCFAKLQ